jgi:hypothetical protein
MDSPFRRGSRLAVPLVLATVLALGTTPAFAISNGVPDGNGHPNVGALLADFNENGAVTGDEAFCSGSLISPTVFLTAGHCLVFLEPAGIETIYVSFDPALLDANGPGTLIASSTWAFDPAFYTSFREGPRHRRRHPPGGLDHGHHPGRTAGGGLAG